MAKITQKHPYLWRFPQKSSNPKRKILYFDFDYKTCWIRRGFEQLSSSIAWQVIGLQSSARKVAHAGLKGLKTPRCVPTERWSSRRTTLALPIRASISWCSALRHTQIPPLGTWTSPPAAVYHCIHCLGFVERHRVVPRYF